MNSEEKYLELIGKRIATLRKEIGLSQLDFALECNINKNYLSDLERGKRNPTLKVLFKIAKGLNIKLSELFEDIGEIDGNN